MLRFALFFLLLLAGAAQAQVTTYCVGDSLGLVNALNSALNSPGSAVIRIRQNAAAYNLKDSVLKCIDQTNGCGAGEPHSFNSLKLLGGYTDSGCSSRSLDSSKTMLDFGGQAQGISMLGSLRVEGLYFKNFKNWSFLLSGGSNAGDTISVLNNGFSGGRVSVSTGLTSGQNLRVLTNLFVGGVDILAWDNADQVTVTGNTVVGAAAKGMYFCLNNTPADVTNNIVWNNSQDIFVVNYPDHPEGCGSAIAAGTIKLSHNVYQTFAGTAGAGSGSNITSDPQFIAAGDYHVQATSPAVNSGDTTDPGVTGTDLDGNLRIVGSAPDIGAYESSVNDLAPTTLTVTNTNDGGSGSLREAITNANASGGTHVIEFNIPTDGSMGSCPYVINLASDLPWVTTPGLYINGFTQPGSKRNTFLDGDIAQRCIVLNGQGRSSSMGLTFYGASSAFYLVQGLAFEGWYIGLNMSAGQNNAVWGNQFGGHLFAAAGDVALSSNAIDIWLWGNTTTTSVGGTDPSSRNIIDSAVSSGACATPPCYAGSGIAISSGGGSNGNFIINNIIGLDGFESAYGNGVGIQLETAHNTISGNVIGSNNNGIQVLGGGASGNSILNNLIGITEQPLCVIAPCSPPAAEPNQAGIYFWQGANTNYVTGNTITNNTLYGIELIDSGTYRNEIAANSIYGNPASWAANGAQLNLDGYAYNTIYSLTANPPPNDYLNYPSIDRVVGSSSHGTITGNLRATNGTYAIEVYSSPTCEAGGAFAHNPRGSTAVAGQDTTHHYDGNGIISFDFNSPFSLTGRYITATATDAYGNTSQFSACKPYQCDVIFRHGFDTATGERCP